MEIILGVFALTSWVIAEAVLLWMILQVRNKEFHCPYSCPENMKCNRESTAEKPNFYSK